MAIPFELNECCYCGLKSGVRVAAMGMYPLAECMPAQICPPALVFSPLRPNFDIYKQ
jgi:hypothetical protein